MGSSYDPFADLYDRAFADIRVRRVEWRWLSRQIGTGRPRVLEIGCGTGAVLRALAPRIAGGLGLDVSAEMLACARARADGLPQLSFVQIAGSALPVARGSHDLVISFLSFRYLAWQAIWPEIRRVLAPGGRFLMVDMVAAPAQPGDLLALSRSLGRQLLLPLRHPRFARDVRALTRAASFRAMVAQHPARPWHEYAAFFAAHLPGRRLTTLDVGRRHRVVALDSGSLDAVTGSAAEPR